ncbi:MAG TPA: DUF1552 domain-containing protein [Polyangiaceae bacterium]|nr:DUF1552 domain-containing protein [Polyangiaceae bacterium]
MKNNPRLIRAARGMERRLFLKALALGLSVPLAVKFSRMATAQASGPVKRFMVMYVPHGVAPEHYNPKMGSDGISFDLDKTNESILGPLQPYKQWVNVYQGLKYPDKGGTHEGIVNCLSGVDTLDDTSPRISVEHVIGKGIGKKPLILGACSHQPFGIDLHGKLFWDGTTHVDPQKNPAKVADTLFGGTSQPTVSDADLRAKLLQVNEAEVADLQKTVTGLSSEQTKLTSFLAGLEAVRSGGGGAVSSCTGKPSLPTVEKVRTASAGIVVDPSGGNDYFYQEANFRLLLQAQLELSAQALICGAAQVIGLMPMYATCEFDFGFIGGTTMPGQQWGHHNGLSHTQAQATGQYNSPISIDNAGKPEVRAPFARAQRWFYQQLVDNLVSVLAKTPDPTASNGSMVLDNTLIYVMSEIGDGQMHNRISYVMYPQIPCFVHSVSIGKCAGAIKAGQVLSFPIDADLNKSARPATDLYLTMAKAMGVASPTFPGTTGLVTGALAT